MDMNNLRDRVIITGLDILTSVEDKGRTYEGNEQEIERFLEELIDLENRTPYVQKRDY